MYDCSVEIVTGTADGENIFRASGILEKKKGGIAVSYREEGDEAVLRATSKRFTMQRTGGCALSASFVEGGKTAMKLGLGANEAAVPLETDRYRFAAAEEGYSIELKYRLCFSAGFQAFSVKIVIKVMLEEK